MNQLQTYLCVGGPASGCLINTTRKWIDVNGSGYFVTTVTIADVEQVILLEHRTSVELAERIMLEIVYRRRKQ